MSHLAINNNLTFVALIKDDIMSSKYTNPYKG